MTARLEAFPKPIIAAVNGLSGVISPDGSVVASIEPHQTVSACERSD